MAQLELMNAAANVTSQEDLDALRLTLSLFFAERVQMTGVVSMTKLLLESTEEIIRAFELLKDIKKNRELILECTHKIGKLESEGDRVYRQEIAFLFDNVKDPIELIKWKDILEYLEDTLDHCEDVSDMIRGVVMKYA